MSVETIAEAVWTYPDRMIANGSAEAPSNRAEEIAQSIWGNSVRTLTMSLDEDEPPEPSSSLSAPTITDHDVGSDTVNLAWTGSTNDYIVRRDGTTIYEGSNITVVDASLSNGTTYTYTVAGVEDDVESSPSTVTVTTTIPYEEPVTAPQPGFLHVTFRVNLIAPRDTGILDTALLRAHTTLSIPQVGSFKDGDEFSLVDDLAHYVRRHYSNGGLLDPSSKPLMVVSVT